MPQTVQVTCPCCDTEWDMEPTTDDCTALPCRCPYWVWFDALGEHVERENDEPCPYCDGMRG